ncbi:MAG: hypothetical protein WAS07_14995 [Micropruina sp.]|nr:hypothetical protein [Micropruina sp.]
MSLPEDPYRTDPMNFLSTVAESAGAGLPRRQLLGAAAWSVPAIIVASAAPAMAASTPGTLTVTNFAGSGRHSGGFGRRAFAQGRVTCGPDDAPITNVILSFGFDSALIADQTPTVIVGTNWSYQGSTVVGSVRYFNYLWTGPTLSGANTSTTDLSIRVDGTSGAFITTIYAKSTGISQGVPVASPVLTLNITST